MAQAEELREHPPTDWIVARVFAAKKEDEEEGSEEQKNASGIAGLMAMFPGGAVKSN